jgi:hypothetical protein
MCEGQALDCSFLLKAATTNGALTYTALGLTKGVYYQFKVKAHNVVGFSEGSPIKTIVAANIPNTPNAPTKVGELTDRTQITVQWTEPV